MLIMNEVKDAERIINKDINGYRPIMAIGVLAKYYIKKLGKSPLESKELIKSNIIKNWPCINISEWDESIDRAIKNAKKFPLKEINEIPITQKEIDVINNIPVKRQQRLAFALLVIAKFNHMSSGHEWVNNSIDEINKVAGVTWNNVREKCSDIHELYMRKLILFPKKIDSTSIKVLYIDMDGEPVMKVKSFENAGNVFMKYNRDDYKHCIDCGKPFEASGNSRGRKVRCDECQHKRNNDVMKKVMRKRRNKSPENN